MNKLKFDMNEAKFDQFARFYIHKGPWLHFETGEIVFTHTYPSPEYRIHYPQHGVSIFMSTDSHAPKMFTPKGTPVPKTTLQAEGSSSPILLHDHATGVVKQLRHWRNEDNKQVPPPLQRFSAYWAGPNAIPIAHPIMVAPANKFTREERVYIKSCVDAAMVACKLTYSEASPIKVGVTLNIVTLREAIESGISPGAFVNTLGASVVRKLCSNGITAIARTTVLYPYLTTKEPTNGIQK